MSSSPAAPAGSSRAGLNHQRKIVAFQSCGVLARGYAPGTGRLGRARRRRYTPGSGSRDTVRQVEDRARQLEGSRVETKTPEPEDDRPLFDGPHRAAVIAQCIVIRV